MDTSYEESSIFSQLEGYDTSPADNQSQLNLASTSSNNKVTHTNCNALSPFSSLTSRIASNTSSSCEAKSKEQQRNYGSDQEEEITGVPVGTTNILSDRVYRTNPKNCDEANSQESISTFSPFSSPVSSPLSESANCKLQTATEPPKQSFASNFGTFRHPGSSVMQNSTEREKQDRTSNKKHFIHPSESDKKDHQGCSNSNLSSSTPTSSCAPYQRALPQTRSTSSSNVNLLKKLMGREIMGAVRKNPANNRDPQIRLFSRLPARLAFCLRDAIPHSAIENGHIFMGFSKCGQFLLSYTQTEADVDLVTLVPHFHYHYRLHWWLFIPYRRAKKVAEVTLFSNSSAAGNLHISFCQWPKDNKKVLVFGCQIGEGAESTFASAPTGYNVSARPCYITVTAIPSLDACKECVKVAANYEEDEMAAQWNSCVRLSCLDHGMTVHTCFDLVPPYPKFEPRVSMKRDSWVLINSGNFLHAMHFDLENLKPKEHGTGTKDQYSAVSGGVIDNFLNSKHSGIAFASNFSPSRPAGITSPQYNNSFALARWSELRISVSEFNAGAHYGSSSQPQYLPVHPSASPYQSHGFFSPTQSQYSPSIHPGAPSSIATTDSSDCESECSSYTTAHSYSKHRKMPMNPERLERVAKFVDQLSPPQLGIKTNTLHPRRFKRIHVYSSENQRSSAVESDMGNIELQAGNAVERKEEGSKRKRLANAADKAYELTDDNFDEESVQEKLSTYRKKRLAEKKYEFTDEDSENIPLPKLRSQQQKIRKEDSKAFISCPLTLNQRSSVDSEDEKQVLRTLNSNQTAGPSKEQSSNETSLRQGIESGLSEDKLLEYVPIPEILSPGGIVTKKESTSCSSSVINASPRSQHGIGYNDKEPFKFHAKFTRRFIEMDDEMVSVMSGIELDDDEGAGSQTGYHSALPLEVHGSGYQAMAMISNAKAEKLSGKCCKVAQYSMDVELFCHTMAQKLCASSGKKYWFCNDYDVEVVDIDPETGDVICVAVVLVTATVVTKTVSQNCQKLSMISSLQRHLHQGGFHFCWNMDTGNCHVINMEPLKEVFKEPNGIWHPAKSVSTSLQRTWGVFMPNSGAGNIRTFTNDSVIRGTSLKTIVDTDHLVAIILDDLE